MPQHPERPNLRSEAVKTAKTGGIAALSLLLAGVVTAWAFLSLHSIIAAPKAPSLQILLGSQILSPRYGWWAWFDQGWYLRSAVAWAHGITGESMHWYLPGYSLLGAPFAYLTPADPFLLPDLGSLLGTMVLFCGLSPYLLGPSRLWIPTCACIFVATAVLPHLVLAAWVTPWTTTPETFCVYATLIASLRMHQEFRQSDTFLAGLAGGSIAAFRPADCAVVLLIISVVTAFTLASRRISPWKPIRVMTTGCALSFFATGMAYLTVWGPHLSRYLLLSGNLGFEPRLLVLRWVNLMVDPGELYPLGRGLASVFCWIPIGVAGMIATLAYGRALGAHVLVIGVVVADIALFLIYRDLHPTGLWRFELYHYFTWALPIFGLYIVRLLTIVVRRDTRRPFALTVACVSTAILFLCQERLHPVKTLTPVRNGVLLLPRGLAPINMAATVPGRGPSQMPVVSAIATLADGRVFHSGFDFVIYAAGGLLRIVPLRPLPAEPTRIRLTDGVFTESGALPQLQKQTIGWGWKSLSPERSR